MTSASDAPAPARRPRHLHRLARIVFLILAQLLLLILVILLPLVVYELVSLTSQRDNPVMLLSGALSWPLYGLWLSRFLRRERLRFVLQQLILLLAVIGAMALLASCSASGGLMAFVRVFPVILAAFPLPALFKPRMARSEAFPGYWKTGAVLGLPLAAGFALLMSHARTLCEAGVVNG